nr:uncharacterized protein I203_07584 [Kwoniella mangroviensis CBS 8507]OCF63160.1 hypothetical protein I203_07584 [Kwoniella mangroviensis CBS 8507]
MPSFQSTPDSNQYSRTSAPEQSTHGASEKNKVACLTCRRGKTKCETTEGKESCKRCTRLKKSNCSLSSDARPFASVAEQVASYLKIYRYSKDFIAKGAVSSNNSFLSPTSVSEPRSMSPSRVTKPQSTAQADAALGWGDKSSCGNCRRRKIKCRTLPGQEEFIGPQFSLVASQTPADSHFPSSLPPQSSDLPALLAEDVGPITAYLQTEEGRQLLSDYLEEIEQGTSNHGSERTVSTVEVSPVAVFAPPISDDGGFDAIDPTVGIKINIFHSERTITKPPLAPKLGLLAFKLP